MTALNACAVVALLAALVLSGLRWLRVAQREHYVAGSATRFAMRWWLGFGPNRLLGAAAVAGVVLSVLSPATAIVAALAIAVGPFRLSLRGRAPGKLVWTPRLRRVASVVVVLAALAVGAAVLGGAAVPIAGLVALLCPLLVDLASAAMAPIEGRLAGRFVATASSRLKEIAPVVVAITGSYGKTSTKVYVAHLCSGSRNVVPTPASFNNRAGLSRAINEHLVPGTEVFVAEMGTYGAGEIRDMCAWCAPSVAAITAIGPVHLERFGSEEAIVAAKTEILESAAVAVLNVDDARLAVVAEAQEVAGREVWRCSSIDVAADVCARRDGNQLVITTRGEPLATVTDTAAQAGNVALAVAVALSLGVAPDSLVGPLASLPTVPNRLAVTELSTGATAIDDTFNSNPSGARAGLAALNRLATPGQKRVVITPGMVELGARQTDENALFGAAIAGAATDLIVVGRTNRTALVQGVESAQGREPPDGPLGVMLVDGLPQAVAWVRGHTGPGDVVLYENDLPDHYP